MKYLLFQFLHFVSTSSSFFTLYHPRTTTTTDFFSFKTSFCFTFPPVCRLSHSGDFRFLSNESWLIQLRHPGLHQYLNAVLWSHLFRRWVMNLYDFALNIFRTSCIISTSHLGKAFKPSSDSMSLFWIVLFICLFLYVPHGVSSSHWSLLNFTLLSSISFNPFDELVRLDPHAKRKLPKLKWEILWFLIL